MFVAAEVALRLSSFLFFRDSLFDQSVCGCGSGIETLRIHVIVKNVVLIRVFVAAEVALRLPPLSRFVFCFCEIRVFVAAEVALRLFLWSCLPRSRMEIRVFVAAEVALRLGIQ